MPKSFSNYEMAVFEVEVSVGVIGAWIGGINTNGTRAVDSVGFPLIPKTGNFVWDNKVRTEGNLLIFDTDYNIVDMTAQHVHLTIAIENQSIVSLELTVPHSIQDDQFIWKYIGQESICLKSGKLAPWLKPVG